MKTLLIAAPAAAAADVKASQPAAPRHHHHHHHGQQGASLGGSAASGGSTASGGSASPGGPAASSGGATPAASPQAATAAAACLSRYLGAKAGISQGGLGSDYVAIVFKNLNNVPCTLYGYPGISLAGGKPVTQIGAAAIENPATPRKLVTLAPGVANALLRIVAAGNYPAVKCGPVTAHWLQIFPPNQTVPIYLYYTAPACTKPVPLLTVNTVAPGSGG